MSDNVSDFLLHRLGEWGVRRIYGFPGDGINGLMGAMDRAGDAFKLVRARHEEMCAFMACAHAKFTGQVGVCMATSGPGAIHLLNGLYDAKLDHQPVVAIVGQSPRAVLGGQYQQEVDLTSLFKDVASAYVEMITVPAQVRHVVDRALRIAISERTVTCIIVPGDVQELDAVETPPRAHGTIHSGLGYRAPRVIPTDTDLRHATELLNAGKKVAILVGAGALAATDEDIEVAELLGAGVAKALLGKAALPDALPFVTGSIGLLGTKPSWDMMMDCDTLLMVGSRFPYLNGNAELITIGDYWKEWADPRLVILVLNNRDLNQVTWEERVLNGDPKYEAAQHVPDFPYAQYAELIGLKGIKVNRPEEIGAAWDAALNADRPCVIEAITDPDVPPLPPHITFKEATAFAESMLKGDVDTAGVIRQSAHQVLATLLPGQK